MNPGDILNLRYFGPAKLVKLYEHRDTSEVVWEVRAESGEGFHLSQRYVETIMSARNCA